MATMPMPTPRSIVLLLLLATSFFLLLPHPSSASVSHPDLILPKAVNDNEAHVVVLTAANFSSFLAVRRHVVVDFYAPWCYWSRKLAPEYAAAAAHLADKGLDVALAKVDATQDRDLARAHGVDGYPTVLFLVDGVPRHFPYYGERTKDAMVAWISQRLGPEVQNVTTIDEAKKIATIDEAKKIATIDEAKKIATIDEAKKIATIDQAKKIATIDEAKKMINGHGMAVLAFLDSLSEMMERISRRIKMV